MSPQLANKYFDICHIDSLDRIVLFVYTQNEVSYGSDDS
jgi:hypothetical protein